MKFKGTGVVWDPARDKVLCQFDKNGEFVATDEGTVQKLIALGYKSDAPEYVDVDIIEEPVEEPVEVKKPAAKRPHKKKEVAK